MKVRLQDRILAQELRRNGLSFSEIIEKIPNLSKGTLNGWLKGIELTEEQKRRIFEKIKLGSNKGRLKGAFRNHQNRIDITTILLERARAEVIEKVLNPIFITGVMLYWAEGDKTQERVGFTNADPVMIQLMMRWFREICKVPETKFRVVLNITTLHNKRESEEFWSEVTGITKSQFHKTHIKQTALKGKRNLSYMGTCRIVISDKNLFRKMLGWKMGVLEYLKINLPS